MRNRLILNDPPYGTERAFNARRPAIALQKREGEEAARVVAAGVREMGAVRAAAEVPDA